MAVSARPALFPEPTIESVMHPALLGAAPASMAVTVDAGHGNASDPGPASCLVPELDWTARFGRDFLASGADEMLARAPTTPGIESSVDIEWYPEEQRLRTTLIFAGPLDIPNGTCWIDDVLTIDAAAGAAVASSEQGIRTSPFAEGACGRFFDHLPNGGAGEQAITLLPGTVAVEDGREVRFIVSHLVVGSDQIEVGGQLDVR